MALTQVNTPDQFHPAYHKAIYLLDSTIKTNDQFRYLFIFQAAGSSTTRKIRVAPRPGDGYGFLDIAQHIRDFMDLDDWDITSVSAIQDAPVVQYQIQFGEEYKDGSGNIVEVLGATLSNRIGFNTILERWEILNYDETDWVLTDVNTNWLCNVDLNTEVYKDDIFWLHVLSAPGTSRLVTTQTNKDGSTNVVNQDLSLDYSNLYKMDLGSALVSPDDAVKFELQWEQNGGGLPFKSSKLIFKLREQCSRFTNYKLIYLDSKGSFNTLNFDHASRRVNSANPKTYEQFFEPITESDISRGITRWFNTSEEVWEVNTDFLTDKHYKMLVDLINSKRVFLDVDYLGVQGVQYFPVEVLTRSVAELKSENQELPQYSVRFRFSFDKISR